jgi:hypothetical protein
MSQQQAHECNLIRQKGESRGEKKQQLRADSSKYLKVFHEKENLNLEKKHVLQYGSQKCSRKFRHKC